MKKESSHAAQQYEALREEAVGDSSWRSHGFLLFVTRGSAAWLEALSTLAPPLRESGPIGESSSNVSSARFGGHRQELTRVLADMVLACSGQGIR